MLAPYRKAVAAVIGVSALIALRYFDIEVLGLDAIVLDLVTGALAAFSVYQIPNA